MPKRATTRSTTQRATPYPRRSGTNVSTVSQANNMAVAVSPMGSMWNHIHPHQQHAQYPIDWQQPAQYEQYQQHDMMLAQNSSVRPHISGAPPVQQVQIQSVPMRSSHSHSNSSGGPWTPAMDDILVENHRKYKWDQIAEKFFHNTKTGNACRKRHARVIMERKEPSRWDSSRVQKVMNAYREEGMRERMWRPLADATGERWQDVERLCYGQGFRVVTSRSGHGHSRQRSRAVSHRSQASINSDGGVRPYDDEEDDGPTDDSGIGADYQPGPSTLDIPQPAYHPSTDTYQDENLGYPDSYYQFPSSARVTRG